MHLLAPCKVSFCLIAMGSHRTVLRPICNCGRPCVDRMVRPATFQRHSRLAKCFKAVDGFEWTWLHRPQQSAKVDRQFSSQISPPPAQKNKFRAASQQHRGDDATTLQKAADQLSSASSAIRAIDADHLVLECSGSTARLLFGHPNNMAFELHEENLAFILQQLRQVVPPDGYAADLKARTIEWAEAMRAHLAELLDTAIARASASNADAALHLYVRNTGVQLVRCMSHNLCLRRAISSSSH